MEKERIEKYNKIMETLEEKFIGKNLKVTGTLFSTMNRPDKFIYRGKLEDANYYPDDNVIGRRIQSPKGLEEDIYIQLKFSDFEFNLGAYELNFGPRPMSPDEYVLGDGSDLPLILVIDEDKSGDDKFKD